MLRAIKRGQNTGKMVPANRLAQHTVVTNLQFVKNTVSVTRNRANCNTTRKGYILFDALSDLCLATTSQDSQGSEETSVRQ